VNCFPSFRGARLFLRPDRPRPRVPARSWRRVGRGLRKEGAGTRPPLCPLLLGKEFLALRTRSSKERVSLLAAFSKPAGAANVTRYSAKSTGSQDVKGRPPTNPASPPDRPRRSGRKGA